MILAVPRFVAPRFAVTQSAVTRFAAPEQIALVVVLPIVQAAVIPVATRSVRDAVPAGNCSAAWSFQFAVREVHYAAEFCPHPVALE